MVKRLTLEPRRTSPKTPDVRIIGGAAGGQLLTVPKGLGVRPTPDKVRQAVFNSLGVVVQGAAVLDLYSGTGALGLECLSRGAASVLSIEGSARHAQYIRANARNTGLAGPHLRVRVQDVKPALRQLVHDAQTFDLILADPPFGPKTRGDERSRSDSQDLLDAAETPALLRPGGWLVLGHARRDRVTLQAPWHIHRTLEHGDSVFRILSVDAG